MKKVLYVGLVAVSFLAGHFSAGQDKSQCPEGMSMRQVIQLGSDGMTEQCMSTDVPIVRLED